MSPREIPPAAHTLAAQIEDNLQVWADRDPSSPRFQTRRAAERATRLIDDLVRLLGGMRDELAAELAAYDAEQRRMME